MKQNKWIVIQHNDRRGSIFMYSNVNREDILQRMLPCRANDPKRQTRPKIAVQVLH